MTIPHFAHSRAAEAPSWGVPSCACEGEARAVLRALGWVALNRALAARRHLEETGQPHREFGNGSLARACASLRRQAAPRALEAAAGEAQAQRLAGGADPTLGALHVYPHWHEGAPAGAFHATALIGPYLFFAPRAEPTPAERRARLFSTL